ncbi:hypothetical protein VIBNIWn13_1020097 [Vibrio nigripulchritudo Wn13]|nr:hypothetical protein VIBNIWn13_1020097 [Vibrio nigripulchritudo Wn13]
MTIKGLIVDAEQTELANITLENKICLCMNPFSPYSYLN